MNDIVIVIKRSLESGPGGVPLHAHYLQKVFPKARLITLNTVKLKGKNIEKLSFDLGKKAEDKGLIKSEDIVITDGFWGRGISNPDRTIIVNHGTYAGCVGENHRFSLLQKYIFPIHPIVSVSEVVAMEAKKYYNISDIKVIMNASDSNMFSPAKLPESKLVVGQIKDFSSPHLAEARNKIVEMGGRWIKIKGEWPKDIVFQLRKCSIFLHLSNYEGCSYAVDEALSCNLPIVGTEKGLLWKYKSTFEKKYNMRIAKTVSSSPSTKEIVNAIVFVHNNKHSFCPKRWCTKYNSFENFSNQWKEYIFTLRNKI